MNANSIGINSGTFAIHHHQHRYYGMPLHQLKSLDARKHEPPCGSSISSSVSAQPFSFSRFLPRIFSFSIPRSLFPLPLPLLTRFYLAVTFRPLLLLRCCLFPPLALLRPSLSRLMILSFLAFALPRFSFSSSLLLLLHRLLLLLRSSLIPSPHLYVPLLPSVSSLSLLFLLPCPILVRSLVSFGRCCRLIYESHATQHTHRTPRHRGVQRTTCVSLLPRDFLCFLSISLSLLISSLLYLVSHISVALFFF